MAEKGFVITVIAILALAFFVSTFGSKVTGQAIGFGSLECVNPDNTTIVTNSISGYSYSLCPKNYRITGGDCSLSRATLTASIQTFVQHAVISIDPSTIPDRMDCGISFPTPQDFKIGSQAICCRIKK